MEAQWFYARQGQRRGPIGVAEAQRLFAQGEILPSDLAWCQGMPQWKPAGELPALRAGADTSTVLVAAVPLAGVPMAAIAAQPSAAYLQSAATREGLPAAPAGYYTSAMGIPQRAMDNLKGHARPRGDTGDWPLDDGRFAQFVKAVRRRRKATVAGKLYCVLLWIMFLSMVFAISAFLTQSTTLSPQTGTATPPVTIFGEAIVVGLLMGFAAFYYLMFRATMRCQRWAPGVMFILYIVGALAYLGVALLPPLRSVGPCISCIVAGSLSLIFGIISWQSYAAIPNYLAQPAWCQELIVKAKL